MKYVFLLFIGLWVLGCKSPEAIKGHISRTQQILVEAKFFEGQDVLSAPRIITSDGEQACVKVGREISIPGQDQPVEAGVTLALTPRLQRGRIIFRGFCQIEEPDGTDNNNDISTVAFYAREAFFEGIANSGELKRVKVNHQNGQSFEVALKFTVVVHNTSHVRLR